MSMKIEILANGLSLTYINDLLNISNNYFISFSGISTIGPIKLDLSKSNYDYITERYFGEYIRKIAYFTIITIDNKKYDIYFNEDAKEFPRKSNKKESLLKRIFLKSTDEEGLSKEAREFAAFEKCEDAVKHLTELRNNVINAINKENNMSKLKNEQKWFTLREKLPDLNTYVLLYVNRPWHDEDDDPKYVVARFETNCENEGELKYKFEQFGPDTFSLDDVMYWSNINKINLNLT